MEAGGESCHDPLGTGGAGDSRAIDTTPPPRRGFCLQQQSSRGTGLTGISMFQYSSIHLLHVLPLTTFFRGTSFSRTIVNIFPVYMLNKYIRGVPM